MLKSILNSLIPNRCISCKTIIPSTQKFLCVKCLQDLPFTHIPLAKDNLVYSKISESISIEYASSLLFFHHGNITQTIIHKMKFQNLPQIGTILAEIWFDQNKNNPLLKEITTIIPVPIHPRRLKQRGYNQIELFGRKIAELVNFNYDDFTISRTLHLSSQTTTRNKKERLTRLKNAFTLNRLENNKHYLLIDDLYTTGGTINSCVSTLLKNPNIKVSILTIACAK